MTALHESRAPYPRNGRLWDETITGRQRAIRRDFLLMLGLDPTRVPDGARIDYDDSTGEYRLQVINPGGHLVWVRRRLRMPLARGGLVPPAGTGQHWFDRLNNGSIARPLAELRDAHGLDYRRGAFLAADVTIVDDATTSQLDAYLAAQRQVGYMRGRGA